MLRKASVASLRPWLSRQISGVSPTIFLRPDVGTVAGAAKVIPEEVWTKVSGLKRFAKHQLSQVHDEKLKSKLLSDVARYDLYLDSPESFISAIEEDVKKEKELLVKLDRYPSLTTAKVLELAEALEKKMQANHDILEQQPPKDYSVDPEYWATSKFQILTILEGTVACLPEGDVPPGAIELLVGQIIDTKIDGEEVYVEVEKVQEGKMMLWFKPDVAVPKNAEIMWSYPNEPAAKVKTGTKLLTQENLVVPSKPGEVVPLEDVEKGEWALEIIPSENEELPQPPKPTPFLDIFEPLVEKLKAETVPERGQLFKKALLSYGEHIDLEAEYNSHYDREVVESKRDKYIDALRSAQISQAPKLNPLKLCVNNVIAKGVLVDTLREIEAELGQEQLLARLHQRRLQGELITAEEELEYRPHVRDEAELENDFYEILHGRYVWQLYPQLDGNEDALVKDLRFKDYPEYINTKAAMEAKHEKEMAPHEKLERQVWNAIASVLAIQQKEADNAGGKLWPGQA